MKKEEEPSQDKEIQEIIERYESMKKEGKNLYLDSEDFEDVAEYYLNAEMYDEALDAIKMGLEIHEDNTMLLGISALLYMEREEFDKVNAIIDQIIDRDDCPIYAWLIRASLLVQNGKEDEARKLIDSLSEYDFLDETDYFEIAATCNKIGFLDMADEWFKKCLEADPDNDEAILEYCANAQDMGRYKETIEWYNKLLDKDPYNAILWAELGISYYHIGDFEKTIEAAEFALVSDTENYNAYMYKAHSLYHLGNYPEAIKVYEELLKYAQWNMEYVHLFISSCYVEMEDWENASKYNQKTLSAISKYSPLFPEAMLNSARCLYGLKRFDEAFEVLANIKEEHPDFITTYLYGARCYFEQGNRQEAISLLDEAIAISPDADTWYQRGMIAIDFNETKIAAEAFEQASQLDPDIKFSQQGFAGPLDDKEVFSEIARMKAFLSETAKASGEKLEEIDIEEYIRIATEEGKNPEIIEKYRSALELLNKIIRDSNEHPDNNTGDDSLN